MVTLDSTVRLASSRPEPTQIVDVLCNKAVDSWSPKVWKPASGRVENQPGLNFKLWNNLTLRQQLIWVGPLRLIRTEPALGSKA
jgi:hypothetical protein